MTASVRYSMQEPGLGYAVAVVMFVQEKVVCQGEGEKF
jgi:hypothetical protein